jgi:hypothetical protein
VTSVKPINTLVPLLHHVLLIALMKHSVLIMLQNYEYINTGTEALVVLLIIHSPLQMGLTGIVSFE